MWRLAVGEAPRRAAHGNGISLKTKGLAADSSAAAALSSLQCYFQPIRSPRRIPARVEDLPAKSSRAFLTCAALAVLRAEVTDTDPDVACCYNTSDV